MKKCSRCDEEAVIKQGHQWLCVKHYRFGQMRANAKRYGKKVPAHADMEIMKGVDLVCPDCQVQMNWRSRDGHCTVASLQHYRDGSMAIVCRSCNTRHAYMEGDSYIDMPKDHKRCPSCGEVKPYGMFYTDNGRSGALRKKSTCAPCSDAIVNEWKEKNREQYNENQRKYRARRKAEGRPVTRKS